MVVSAFRRLIDLSSNEALLKSLPSRVITEPTNRQISCSWLRILSLYPFAFVSLVKSVVSSEFKAVLSVCGAVKFSVVLCSSVSPDSAYSTKTPAADADRTISSRGAARTS
ncbi:hypothetical protein L798_03500 [Zootermopsis nevadensis]|uniref:Uncharacterized protein n=1 Tax=Zootermopsis nevadensis TaxID=136037 RepID=A0A067QIJ1_ZOONE|nr:hypothetical protein L798_03500 [Zootermopsis nevadensis]